MVGAVIVYHDTIIGEGYHIRCGEADVYKRQLLHQIFNSVITQITYTTLMSMMYLLVVSKFSGFYIQATFL